MEATLLVELLTEELPPKSLSKLGQTFADEVFNGLVQYHLKLRDFKGWRVFTTPRRLAVLIPEVNDVSSDRQTEISGPSVNAVPQAIAGFAKKHGVDVRALEERDTPKGKVYVANISIKGIALDAVLANIVSESLKKLPIPKVMRWGSGDAQFVRPVHGLVMLHGSRVIPGKIFDIESTNFTRGHRALSSGQIKIDAADSYEQVLRDKGHVEVNIQFRRARIKKELLRMEENLAREAARKPDGRIPVGTPSFVIDTEREDRPEHIFPQTASLEAVEKALSCSGGTDLLDEVNSLVEWPRAYWGKFDEKFLGIPVECLALTMKKNQKYFPVFDKSAKLLPYFVVIGNNDDSLSSEIGEKIYTNISSGNERVVRPRLADADFFFNQDRKQRLEERIPQLAKVVYHNKLGSQLDRVQRIKLLAGKIARVLGADAMLAERAAELAKADLLTGMVGEFPELQGVMGRYYALHDKEPAAVADAIEAHYRPRFAGDRLPQGNIACAVALADKFDAIAGLFSIGQQPTGDKDPFGLRRAALGIVRILVESRLHLSLKELATAAFQPFKTQASGELQAFIYDRFAGYLKEQGFSTLQVDAVLSKGPVNLGVVPQQLEAVKAFQALPEAESLAAANKRIVNILKQAEAKGEFFANAEPGDLKEPAERALHEAVRLTSEKAKTLYEKGDYTGYLKSFSVLKAPVDTFFDKVMVMVDDDKLRRGRLALLRDLREAMNRVADISKLAT